MTVEDLSEKQTEELERQKSLENRILCCTAAGCVSCGADGLRSAIATEIKNDPDAYTDLICAEMLPAVRAWWEMARMANGGSS